MNIKSLLLLGGGVAVLTLSSAAIASEAIATKAGCLACHAVDKKVVGPSYKDIAAKYKGQADAAAKLADKVRKGGVGVWGPPPIPMPPNPVDKISDADLKTVVQWVLAR
jgi:cytochrome c